MRQLLEDTARRAIGYLESLPTRRVSPSPDAVARLSGLDELLNEHPLSPEQAIEMLDGLCTPASMAMAGPRFFGFVIGGSLPVAVAANWLAAAWDQNAGLYNVTPAVAKLEQVVLRWLLGMLHLPAGSGGAFVTGATMANFCALAAARHDVWKHAGWNVEADGMFGASPVTVIVGAEAHPTLFKSLGLLGLGRNRVVRVPADSQGRLRPALIPHISGPTIVCTQAGNVNTGAFDPVGEICELAHAAGAWVHVDGAFGLWASVTPFLGDLTAGIPDADSRATDAHKWLNVPYDSGLAFVRDAEALRAAMAITAEYLPTDTEHRNPSDYVPELSRRARGVELWDALKSLGKEGVAEMIERCCRHARRFAEGFRSAGFQILNDVVLNQVLVSFGDSEETLRIVSAIQADGTCWCGGTVWQEKTAMRISVSCWATTDTDVEKSLDAMLRIAGRKATR